MTIHFQLERAIEAPAAVVFDLALDVDVHAARALHLKNEAERRHGG